MTTNLYELKVSLLFVLKKLLLIMIIISLTIITIELWKTVLENFLTNYNITNYNITNYDILIDSRNFYDKSIGDQVKNFEEIRKIATGLSMFQR